MPAQAASPHVAASPPLSQLCEGIRLTKDGRALIRDEMEPLAYVRLLQERALFPDAINVLARLFSKRESVWWGCQCTRQSLNGAPLPAKSETAVEAAEKWVSDPSEEHRRPLFTLAQGAGMDTCSGLVTFAAFASGGSLAPPEYDVVPPEESLTAELAAASVLMASVAGNPDDVLEKFRLFLEQGIGLYENREA